MRSTLKGALLVLCVAVVVVVGLLIAKLGAVRTVEPTVEDVKLKIPTADEMMGIVPVADQSPSSRIHIVKKGEWLSTICPSDWKGVAELNSLENPDLIYPGQRLSLTDACEAYVAKQDDLDASAETIADETFDAPTPPRATREISAVNVPVLPVVPPTEVVGNRAMQYDANGVIQCDVTLPAGEKAFQWRQPGIHPIGDNDPEEYLSALAHLEGLPEEARGYFLAELRKGDKGAFDIETLFRCQYLGTMAGKKVRGKITVHRHTVINWIPKDQIGKRISWDGRKQTKVVSLENDKARRYEFVVGEDRWVLLRANICGNLILRKEPVLPPKVEEPVPIPIARPPDTPPSSIGTCVPQSRPCDRAMPGCVPRAPLSDATPACAAPQEPALNQNFDPARERRIPEESGGQGPPIVPIAVGVHDGDHHGIPPARDDRPRLLSYFSPNGEDPLLSCADFDRLMIGTHACP